MTKVKIPKGKLPGQKVENLKAAKKPKRGGKRENSGRKSAGEIQRLTREAARVRFNNWVDANWGLIEQACLKYAEKGDKDFLMFMINQRIGMAPKTVEVGGDPDNPVQIIIKQEGKNGYKL